MNEREIKILRETIDFIQNKIYIDADQYYGQIIFSPEYPGQTSYEKYEKHHAKHEMYIIEELCKDCGGKGYVEYSRYKERWKIVKSEYKKSLEEYNKNMCTYQSILDKLTKEEIEYLNR